MIHRVKRGLLSHYIRVSEQPRQDKMHCPFKSVWAPLPLNTGIIAATSDFILWVQYHLDLGLVPILRGREGVRVDLEDKGRVKFQPPSDHLKYVI